MSAATVFIAPLPNQETCTLTGLAVSVTPDDAALSLQLVVTNVGVSQDPADEGAQAASSTSSAVAFAPSLSTSLLTPSSASFSSRVFRRRRASSLTARAPTPDVQRVFDAVSVSGSTVIPWTVDVPTGFYVVSARVNGATDAQTPRFFVDEGSDTSCILASTSLSSISTSATSTSVVSAAPSSSGSGNRSHGQDQQSVATDPSKLGIPIAAIVGIIIAVLIFIVLGVLICKWDRQRHRNAATMRKEEPAQPQVMSSTSTFFDRGPGTMFATAVTRTD